MTDIDYMKLALNLAKRAEGRTSPNPLVGAVIVKSDQIIGKGYHHYAGGAHAEINALNEAGIEAKGADLYVNLEPCSHYGKTPPCSQAIIAAGIKRVIIGMKDPNPIVAGRGIKILKEAGIEVEIGVLEEECKRLNEVFIKYITIERPFVILKNALTLDGKIATKSGDSRWISGEESRLLVHKLRDKVDGILVGIGTVLADNPRLTTRLPDDGRDATRIILDSKLRIPLDANLVVEDSSASTIIITTSKGNNDKKERLQELGVEVIEIGAEINLEDVLKELGKREFSSLLVEGGSRINTAFLEGGLVDKVYYFIAPKIIGGEDAIQAVAGRGVERVKDGIKIIDKEVKMLGEDILLVGYVD